MSDTIPKHAPEPAAEKTPPGAARPSAAVVADERARAVRALRIIIAAQPWRTLLVIALSLMAGFAEGLGIAAFLPLLGMVIDTGEAGNWLTELVSRIFAFIDLQPTLLNVLVLMVGSIVLKAILVMVATREAAFASLAATRRLRQQLLEALLQSRWSYLSRLPTGQTSHLLVTETSRAAGVYTTFTNLVVACAQVVVYLGLALMVSWMATLCAILMGLIVLRALSFLMTRIRDAGRGRTHLLKSLSNRLVEAIGFFKPLKAMHLEQSVLPFFARENVELEHLQQRMATSNAVLMVYYEPLFAVLLALGFYFAKSSLGMPFIDMVALALLFYRSGGQLIRLQQAYQGIAANESVLTLVQDMIQETTEARESLAQGASPTLTEGIVLDGVSFDYGEGKVLRTSR